MVDSAVLPKAPDTLARVGEIRVGLTISEFFSTL
jgi:hypothetical protein